MDALPKQLTDNLIASGRSGGEQSSRSGRDYRKAAFINTSFQRGVLSSKSAKPLQRFFYRGTKPLKRFKELCVPFVTSLKRGVNEIRLAVCIVLLSSSSSFATTKGLSQIVTPDLEPPGDLSLSLQIQDKRIANPYELQAELGLTRWAEVAVFRGFKPDEWIFGTEIGLLTKEPFLLSVGFVNWSPHLDVDPQPYIEAGYYTEHHKVIAGAIHTAYKNEAILGYAYDFNERWRVQVDWQSGSENSSTIGFTCNVTPDFQFNPALYVNNGPKHDLFGYIVFTYTFHLWGREKKNAAVTKSVEHVAGAK
ncbi:MAG TPA: hypothetical protein VH227_06435 [Candidatus Udaeobacter sp.]|nr:hypothetical protein [Candidatus Udaeobacter sp.]